MCYYVLVQDKILVMVNKSTLVAIDSSVSDRPCLLAGLKSDTEVILIESQEDGIVSITNKIQKKIQRASHSISC